MRKDTSATKPPLSTPGRPELGRVSKPSRGTDIWGQGRPQHRPPQSAPSHPMEAGREGAYGSQYGAGASVSPCPGTSHPVRAGGVPAVSGVPRPVSCRGGLHGPALPTRHKIPATGVSFCVSLSPRAPPVVCLLVSWPWSGGAGVRAGGFRAAPLTQKRTGPDVNPASFVMGDSATGKAQLSLAFALGCRWGRGVGAPLYCLLPPHSGDVFFFFFVL